MKKRSKFSPFDTLPSKAVHHTKKQKQCPVKAYFEAVRLVELAALSGDEEKF